MKAYTREELSGLVLGLVENYSYSTVPVTLDATFSEINLDKIDLAELVMDIYDDIAVDLPDVDYTTGAQVLAAIEEVLRKADRLTQ